MSKNKAKGTRAESAVVAYLQEAPMQFPHAERRALAGASDKGDVLVGPGVKVVVEVKDHAKLAMSHFLDEAVQEGENAKADLAAAWVKRRGKGSPADWYVVMTGAQFKWVLWQLYGGAS